MVELNSNSLLHVRVTEVCKRRLLQSRVTNRDLIKSKKAVARPGSRSWSVCLGWKGRKAMLLAMEH